MLLYTYTQLKIDINPDWKQDFIGPKTYLLHRGFITPNSTFKLANTSSET